MPKFICKRVCLAYNPERPGKMRYFRVGDVVIAPKAPSAHFTDANGRPVTDEDVFKPLRAETEVVSVQPVAEIEAPKPARSIDDDLRDAVDDRAIPGLIDAEIYTAEDFLKAAAEDFERLTDIKYLTVRAVHDAVEKLKETLG